MTSSGADDKFIHVVAAAITDAAGRILIAQRPPGKMLAGSWEFPGGKVEHGESRVRALARELHEELGITLSGRPRPLMRFSHSYPFGDVLIDMWVVTRYSGEPARLDGQALRWCSHEELATADLLPADRPIIRTLRLPERLHRETSTHYDLGGSVAVKDRPSGKLIGAYCCSVEEGCSAAHLGAEFLAVRRNLPEQYIAKLCNSVNIPVYVRGLELDEAFSLGASGTTCFLP